MILLISSGMASIAFSPSVQINQAIIVNNELGDVQANVYVTGAQYDPSICVLDNETVVFGWRSWLQDLSSWSVHARIFNPTTGVNTSAEFQINTYTNNLQGYVEFCRLSDDTFVACWLGEGSEDDYGVYAKVFNATTTMNITREFLVNNYTAGGQGQHSLCALSSEKFVVTWAGEGIEDNGGVYAKVFNAATGNNLTREFLVNEWTNNVQGDPFVCALTNDSFAIAWDGANDANAGGIAARVFNATTGNNMTREFMVNYYETGGQQDPTTCGLSSDTFVVVWDGSGEEDSTSIYARVMNATSGTNMTREFRVNQYTTGLQDLASTCALSSEQFAVAWAGVGTGDDAGVFMRMFDASGKGLTDDVLVNKNTTNVQDDPTIWALGSDAVAISWESEGQDTDDYGTFFTILSLKPDNPEGPGNGDDDPPLGASIPGFEFLFIVVILALGTAVMARKKGIQKHSLLS